MLHPANVVREVERLSKLPFWPGFHPLDYPLALYDGDGPHLFRHPSPPAEIPNAMAHTIAEIGGVLCATVLLGGPGVETLADAAATSVHELFHVYQQTHRPEWKANEAHRFTYPIEDAELLALRRLETEALRRALEAVNSAESARWGAVLAQIRKDRHARLTADHVAYEDGLEALEGLAYYVEHIARGDRAHHLPVEEWPADAVRIRCYLIGRGIALLLDRHLPGWQSRPFNTPAELLGQAFTGAPAAAFTARELEAADAAARQDVEALRARRRELRAQFLAMPGEVLEIVADSEPLRPRGIDPMNLHRLEDAEVLHTRFLRLGGATGSIQVNGRQALTLGAGTHPIFAGVRRVLLTGLPALAPEHLEGGGIRVEAPGLTAEFSHAHTERCGTTLIVRV